MLPAPSSFQSGPQEKVALQVLLFPLPLLFHNSLTHLEHLCLLEPLSKAAKLAALENSLLGLPADNQPVSW